VDISFILREKSKGEPFDKIKKVQKATNEVGSGSWSDVAQGLYSLGRRCVCCLSVCQSIRDEVSVDENDLKRFDLVH